jgi:hypothetical protein
MRKIFDSPLENHFSPVMQSSQEFPFSWTEFTKSIHVCQWNNGSKIGGTSPMIAEEMY